jgi:glycosyl transferase, family 25
MDKIKQTLDNIFVVHGISGYETRETYLRELFKKNEIGYQFVTESHDSEVNDTNIKKYFTDNIKSVLRKGALYCTLVHILIYELFLKSDHKYAIIFENDVCFLGSFPDEIQPIIEEANLLDESFIISLENSTLQFPSWRKTRKGKYIYEAKTSRCAGAYMMDKKAASRILEYAKQNKCNQVIDWWHNHLVEKKVIKMYWAHPPLTEQGSFNGKLTSTISVRAGGNLRSFKWSLQKFYKMYLLRLFR